MQRGHSGPFAQARLGTDPEFRYEVEAARDWGVPHSVLMGRVPKEGEPLFTAQDHALAVALRRLEAFTCECGQPREESMKPENQYAYTATAYRCHSCATRHRAAQDWDGDQAGLLFAIEKKEEGNGRT